MSTTVFYKINDFFEAYAHALENYDAKMMAMQYALPCTFLSDDASNIFQEANKLEGLFVQGTTFYKQFGVAHARPQVWSKRMWTEKICKVKVNWQYFDKENQPIYNCDYQYILRLDKHDKWKIELSVAVNEKERMEEWLKKKRETGTNI
ncbi:MAG TPA: hypothetical protein PL009_05435 [Flavipsychrobacter sp.]|nr:hypothetical protein [Flavipsychrobacter sp.]